MSIRHLTDDELDELIATGTLPDELQGHARSCVVCRRRLDTFGLAVSLAAGDEPSAEALERAREGALERWGAPAPRVRWRWAAAAAAVVVLGLVPLLRPHLAPQRPVDSAAVLAEVDRVLARDPLAALASADVLDEVVPAGAESGEGGAS